MPAGLCASYQAAARFESVGTEIADGGVESLGAVEVIDVDGEGTEGRADNSLPGRCGSRSL